MIFNFGFIKLFLLDILRQFQPTGFNPNLKSNSSPKKAKRWGKGRK